MRAVPLVSAVQVRDVTLHLEWEFTRLAFSERAQFLSLIQR
jgi:hypothetical protein